MKFIKELRNKIIFSFFRFQIILFVIFVSFTYWINAQDIRGGYQWDDKISGNGTVHWINCTFNGTTYYDDDCIGWFGKFVLWMGNLLKGYLMEFDHMNFLYRGNYDDHAVISMLLLLVLRLCIM